MSDTTLFIDLVDVPGRLLFHQKRPDILSDMELAFSHLVSAMIFIDEIGVFGIERDWNFYVVVSSGSYMFVDVLARGMARCGVRARWHVIMPTTARSELDNVSFFVRGDLEQLPRKGVLLFTDPAECEWEYLSVLQPVRSMLMTMSAGHAAVPDRTILPCCRKNPFFFYSVASSPYVLQQMSDSELIDTIYALNHYGSDLASANLDSLMRHAIDRMPINFFSESVPDEEALIRMLVTASKLVSYK